MVMASGFCIIPCTICDIPETLLPLLSPPRSPLINSVSPPSPLAGVGSAGREVDPDGMRALAWSRPDFRFALLGSISSPCWNMFADS